MNVYYTDIAHTAEMALTGRSIGDSNYKSTEQEHGGNVRRNAKSYAGQAVGAGAALGTLGGLFLAGNAVAGPVGGTLAVAAIPGYNLVKGLYNTYKSKRAHAH